MFDILQKAAHAGGEALLHYFRTDIQSTEKTSQHDIVTIADITAQKAVQDTLIAEFTKKGFNAEYIGFIGEEDLQQERTYTCIIDPLDGTSNFTSGFDMFGVSIGLFKERKPVAGLVYIPTRDSYYYGETGQGAFKVVNGKKTSLQMSLPVFKKSLLFTNISTNDEIRKDVLNLCDHAIKSFKNIRVLGAAALDLCFLADNICSAAIYGKVSLWDIAAGVMMVRESGGEVYDWEGMPIELDFEDRKKIYKIIAIHPEKRAEILSLTNSTKQ